MQRKPWPSSPSRSSDAAPVEIGVEQAQALGRLIDLLQRGRACQQQHLVGDLGGRDPHLGAVDDVAVAPPHRAGFQLRRVEAGIGLGDREAGLLLAGDERGQHAALLCLGAEHHHRVQSENVHVHGGSARHAGAGFGDGLHHERRLGDAESGAAVFLRHGDAEPATFRERLMKIVGKTALTVAL